MHEQSFNPEPYIKVNREERFYCALLGHALLTSSNIRAQFATLVAEDPASKENGFALDTLRDGSWEIYLEVAALRDYWNDLGTPDGQGKQTDQKREAILTSILNQFVKTDPDLLKARWVRTHGAAMNLWNPGHWPLDAINKESTISKEAKDQLKRVKLAFNAKPDMLILGNDTGLMIEAKIESAEGVYKGRIAQAEIQELIVTLLCALTPTFSGKDIRHAWILPTPKEPRTRPPGHADGRWIHLRWSEICGIVEKEEKLDRFTKQTFLALLHRVHPSLEHADQRAADSEDKR
jgi:hypothetical protein